MLISKKKAKAKLKTDTGLSVAECSKLVDKYAMHRDGARNKIHALTLRDLIESINRVSKPKKTGVNFSLRTKARIRALA